MQFSYFYISDECKQRVQRFLLGKNITFDFFNDQSLCLNIYIVIQGLVQAVGVSNYGPKQLLKIHDYLKDRGVPLCSAQVECYA